MRERLKSFILFILIISSLFLTTRLLFGQPITETAKPPAFEELAFGELRSLPRQVLPELRFLHGEGWRIAKPWDMMHDAAWERIQLLFLYTQAPTTASGPPEAEDGPYLWVVFPFSVPPSIWDSSQRLAGLEITELAWHKSDPQALWLHDAREGWLRSELLFLPTEWDEALAATFERAPLYILPDADDWEQLGYSTEGAVFLPAEVIMSAPRGAVHEELDREKLLRSIFVDTALVRLIEERDGAYIYTDGQKGLRMFDSGEVEFSAPSSEPGSETISTIPALRRTAQYLQLMGGWPDYLYLNYLGHEETVYTRRQWDAYTATFIYAEHGMRLLSTTTPVKLRFSDRGIIYYSRHVWLLTGVAEELSAMTDPLEALSTVRMLLDEEGKTPAIAEIYPAYFLRDAVYSQSIAEPSWVITFADHRKAIVNAMTGRFSAWLE